MIYAKIEEWLSKVLKQEIPSAIAAFCFNLYEDGEGCWSLELVGTENFDPEDEDWACDEITDLGTRDEPFSWEQEADWAEVLEKAAAALKQYLDCGRYADVLKACEGVGVGFVDGNLEILYAR